MKNLIKNLKIIILKINNDIKYFKFNLLGHKIIRI